MPTRGLIGRTSVDDVVSVEVVDGIEHLADGLGGILLGELALFADPVEQLPTCCELRDNVVLILRRICQHGRAPAWIPLLNLPSIRTSPRTGQCVDAATAAASPARRTPSARCP